MRARSKKDDKIYGVERMKEKLLTVKEREEQGAKVIKLLKEILGAKKLGLVQKATIKAEVNEAMEIEIKTWL